MHPVLVSSDHSTAVNESAVVMTGGRPARKQRYKPQLTAASYRYFIRGQSDKAAAADFKVAKRKRIQLKAYDKLLKSFQYREALDAALAGGRPEVITSLVQELAIRSGLPAALGKRRLHLFTCSPVHNDTSVGLTTTSNVMRQ